MWAPERTGGDPLKLDFAKLNKPLPYERQIKCAQRIGQLQNMKLTDFDFELPKELIAQFPAEKRDHSRLLVLHRDTGELEHRKFSDIIEYLNPEDALVINQTKVFPARLFGINQKNGIRSRGFPAQEFRGRSVGGFAKTQKENHARLNHQF